MASNGQQDTDRLRSATVRILTSGGEVVGAGFVVRPDLVATCAHVVALAVGCDPGDGRAPEHPVIVDFPWSDTPVRSTARVRHWSPIRADGRGDLAVLELVGAAPDRVALPAFWHDEEPWGREFRVLGFPAELPGGAWVSGEFRARQEQGWLQLQAATGGQPITGGFSGAPVWDTEAEAVTGMAVVADRRRYTRTAFMVPIGEVLGMDSGLVTNPYRGWEPFDEEHADLFFGRDDDIERVMSTLERRPLVAVAGRSGVGKSSLIRAGVIPWLRARGVRIATVRLGSDRSGLHAVTERLDAGEDEPFAAWLTQQSAGAPGTLAPPPRLLEELPAQGVLLFVDQFEELASTAPQRARELLRSLIELTRSGTDRPVRVVLTVRWDALDELVDDELAAFLDGATVALAPMGRAQLRDAIRRPTARAPGALLADELVERLIDDTIGEPGGLPLLQSLLSDLWAQRGSGVLDVADYERVDGVAGAVTRRAEEVFAQFDTPQWQQAAQRLLTLLAVPSVSGAGFVRSVVSMREYPELRGVAGRLARDRLVVVGRDAQGADTVELAHQALIDHWPRLLGWLRDDRDFRLWQWQIGQERAKWEHAGKDGRKDTLLRPGALEAATAWADKRGSDIPAPDREYIAASRKERRREVRRWQLVTTLIAVLAVAAASTAVVAYRTSQERAAQLRLQAARTLAAESMRVADTEPGKALQFAQAAARYAPNDPAVSTALLYQQVRIASVVEMRTGPWSAGTSVAASGDGSIVAVAERGHDIGLWTGLDAERPTSWRLPPTTAEISSMTMSGNGSRLAVVTADGAVVVWNLRDRKGPFEIRVPEPDPLPSMAVFATFDETGKWLAVRVDRKHDLALGNTDLLELYDTSGTAPARVATPLPENGVTQYPAYIDASGALIAFKEIGAAGERNVVRDARTGSWIRDLPAGVVTSAGAIVGCADDKLVVWDATTGAERFRPAPGGPLGACEWTTSGRYAIRAEADDGDTVKTADIVDLRTGRRYALQARNNKGPKPIGNLMVPTEAGPRLLSITADGFSRFAPATPVEPADDLASVSDIEWGPDGRFIVSFEAAATDSSPGMIRVLALSPGRREVARVSADGGRTRRITDDGRHLVVASGTGAITLYSLPNLTVEWRLTLPFPSVPGLRQWSVTSIMQSGADELALLHAGLLTRWRIDDGRQLGRELATWGSEDELRWTMQVGVQADLVPTQPDRFVTMTPDAYVVRDVHDGHVLHSITMDQRESLTGRAFTRPGAPIVYIRYDSGRSVVQNLGTGVESVSPQPIPSGDPIGMTPDGLLVVNKLLDGVEVWDFERGTKLFEIKTARNLVVDGATLLGHTLHLLSYDGEVYTINLDRNDIMGRLCPINDRAFTDAERNALPLGADATPPCRDR
ncbi:trypsin-like peptidase domain-containing protein [Nocardia sp. CA2R105]|uniref:nSTAND1 domain-containing NTPase n=1 Tax=Nocardia coffeae TaxID=2873381 RepID=UPI001CA7AACD|nr:trypsin-like peptidase domain-containing protein [Nocardia coffeae]MBY8856190.1 trypsin-like peptidase domain-containing protein [Nocardia coffeae]